MYIWGYLQNLRKNKLVEMVKLSNYGQPEGWDTLINSQDHRINELRMVCKSEPTLKFSKGVILTDLIFL